MREAGELFIAEPMKYPSYFINSIKPMPPKYGMIFLFFQVWITIPG